jgi:hypothetical protein
MTFDESRRRLLKFCEAIFSRELRSCCGWFSSAARLILRRVFGCVKYSGGSVFGRIRSEKPEKLEAVHMKFLIKTTLMTTLPRERMMCLPSREYVKLKISSTLKVVNRLGGPFFSGCRQRLIT